MSQRKYELTNETYTLSSAQVPHRIKALRDFGYVDAKMTDFEPPPLEARKYVISKGEFYE